MVLKYDILSEISKYSLTEKIYLKLALTCVIGFVIAVIFYYFYNDKEHWYNLSEKKNLSFYDYLFYTFTCLFTLGFGEIIPKSNSVKFMSVIVMFLAYIIIML
jgi:CBS domain containing-hemolysin-like protein